MAFSSGFYFVFYFLAHLIPSVQMSFSDHLLPVVCLSINFSHVLLLHKNHWAKFNQPWYEASLWKGILNC